MQFTWKDAMRSYTEKDWMEFVFFAANVQHILGIDAFHTQEQLYRQVCGYANRQASTIGNPCRFAVNGMNIPKKEEPGFILTFHFGLYRAIPAFLLQRGYKLCIPVSKDVIVQQQQYYSGLLGDGWASELLFLEAEDPHLFFKMRRQMALGFHILCYVDGGAAALADGQRKLMTISFLDGYIAVPLGIIKMAYLLKTKIGVLIADPYPDNDVLTIRALNFCDTTQYGTCEDFAAYYLKSIYRDFERVLAGQPYAWEAWLYGQRTMRPTSQQAKWDAKTRLILFKNKERYLLLDKFSYLSYSISCKDFERLSKSVCV